MVKPDLVSVVTAHMVYFTVLSLALEYFKKTLGNRYPAGSWFLLRQTREKEEKPTACRVGNLWWVTESLKQESMG